MSYSISGGNSANKFAIHANTGRITVAGDLDYESAATYTLTVQASDAHGGTATATVNIMVTNVGEISISAAGNVVEGGDMTFTVTAGGGGVTVTYTIGGTADSSDDYASLGTGTLSVTVDAGETTKDIVINTTSDRTAELFESVTITLGSVTAGSGVIDSANSSATAYIEDQISVSPIGDDAATLVEVETSQSTGTVLLKLDADGSSNDSNNYDHRAYVLNVEVHRTGGNSTGWTLGQIKSAHTKDTSSNTYTTALPNYADLGDGQIVWVEGGNPPGDRYVLLEVDNAGVSHDKYRISIAKPDFAIISRPTLATTGATSSTKGHVTMTVTIRNSTDRDSADRDDQYSVVSQCFSNRGPRSGTESTSFEDLRDSGSTSLLPSESDVSVQVPTVCLGASFSSGDAVHAYALLSGNGAGGWQQGWVSYGSTIIASWPFDVNTLWHPQSTIIGGLQILINGGFCTLSFPLTLKNSSGTDAQGMPITTETKGMSTTGHCAALNDIWEQGAKGDTNVSLGTTFGALQPVNTDCKILDDDGTTDNRSDCRRGDQSYATKMPPPAVDYSVFRPAAINSLNKDHGLSIQHFDKHDSLGFNIVGARPPHEDDIVRKVGRTTGWTTGEIIPVDADDKDPTCPGNMRGISDHRAKGYSYYVECLVWATYQSEGGDSGSPVFVGKGRDDVLLVGVHFGGSGDNGIFIPIERIYAESLLKGYDWVPKELRPLPTLDDNDESIKLSDDGLSIEAKFAMREFSQSNEGMTYEAALHRNGAAVMDTGGTEYRRQVSRNGTLGNVARFELSRIPVAQRNGEFTVKVRLCPYAIGSTANTSHCGDYGSEGDKSLRLPPPAPENFRKTGGGIDNVRLSWDAITGATSYELDYRVNGETEWEDVSGSSSGSSRTISDLTCGTRYEFRVRAEGDGTTYVMTWGAWSAVLEAITSDCPDDAPPPPKKPTVSLASSTFTISWGAVTGADQYRAQHRTGGSTGQWTNLGATTSTSQTFSPQGGLTCGTTYDFRVQARGNGVDYRANWSQSSKAASHTTAACNHPPVFDEMSYSFTVREDASAFDGVGDVSAMDADSGDTVTYAITGGNEGKPFNITHNRGAIIVWGALNYETTSSYTLTVTASDGRGGTATVTVTINVTDVAE